MTGYMTPSWRACCIRVAGLVVLGLLCLCLAVSQCDSFKESRQRRLSSKHTRIRHVGFIEEANAVRISGWLCVPNTTDNAVRIQVLFRDRLCGEGSLTQPRADVLDLMGQHCTHSQTPGFRIALRCGLGGLQKAHVRIRLTSNPTITLPFIHLNNVNGLDSLQKGFQTGILKDRQPFPIEVTTNVPRRLNILMCGVGRSLTGGPLSIMHFAVLAAVAGFRVRWLNINGGGLGPDELMAHVKKYDGLSRFEELVEYVPNAYQTPRPIEMNPDDLTVATIYFTAFMAAALQRQLRNPNFIYFIQDFEPIFFAQNSEYLQALETYTLPHFPIFSTPFLQHYFIKNHLGLYACHSATNSPFDWAAQPAIRKYAPLNLTAPAVRTLVVYARKHAERNAYEFTMSALNSAVIEGVFDGEPWQMVGVGALKDEMICGLGGRPTWCLHVKQNVAEPAYLKMLADADVGLSLMVSPHPSLPPFDFAAAGMVVVTNSFATKDQPAFTTVSRNILAAKPTIDGIVEGLRQAVVLSRNRSLRREQAQLKWASAWDDDRCYGPTLFQRMQGWVGHRSPLNACLDRDGSKLG